MRLYVYTRKKLWTKCRKLWDSKGIWSFWVSNGSISVKLVNENVSMIVIWRSSSLVIHWLQIQLDFISTDMVHVCVLILCLVAFHNFNFLFATLRVILRHLDKAHFHRFFIMLFVPKLHIYCWSHLIILTVRN